MRYRVLIEQDEDGFFVAEVPSLPGCISQGSNPFRGSHQCPRSHCCICGEPRSPPGTNSTTGFRGNRWGRRLSELPRISGVTLRSSSGKIGYVRDRQRGSHIVLRQGPAPFRRLIVSDHKEIAKGTLRAIIREAGLTVEEFRELAR